MEQTRDKLAGFIVLSHLPADVSEFARVPIEPKVLPSIAFDVVGPNKTTRCVSSSSFQQLKVALFHILIHN